MKFSNISTLNNTKNEINEAYFKAMEFAQKHYENFPVVSFLVPKPLRKHIAIIYWFARTADDIADEGKFSESERMEKLILFEKKFNDSLNQIFSSPFELALFSTITEMDLTHSSFLNLLKAFRQDVVKKRYKDFNEVLEYCNYSANPVGRLILELNGIRNEKAFELSDKICTALQLTNFYQDTLIDYKKGRIYVPQDEMEKFGIDEKMFELNKNNLNLRQLVKFNVDRILELFNEGKKLYPYLNGKLKYEIKWTVLGGEAILRKIEDLDYNIFDSRPVLNKKDFFLLLFKAFFV